MNTQYDFNRAAVSVARLLTLNPGRVGVFSGLLATQPAPVQRDVAAEIERLGFGSLWFGESVPGREAFVQAAIFLNATEKLVVGSGIASIYARDSYAAQAAARSLGELSENRFILGLGVSHPAVIGRRGHTFRPPIVAMSEYLDGIGAASAQWRGLATTLPPIVLAALRPQMLRLAADRAAGAFTYFSTDDHTRTARHILGPEPFLVTDLPVVVEADPARARAIGNRHTTRYLQIDTYRAALLGVGFSEADLEPPGSQALFDAVVAWGSPEAVARRIQARLNAGADLVLVNLAVEDLRRPYVDELRVLAPALTDLFA